MKFSILIIFTLVSINAFACPNINGSFYKCTTGDRVMDVMMGIHKAKLEIVQNGKDISATFMGKTTQIKIDETVEMENYSQSQRATIYSSVYSSCTNDILRIEEESKLVYDNGKIEHENSETDIYMKNKKIHMDIVQHQENGQDVKLNITCKRK